MNYQALNQALSLIVERRAFSGPFDDVAARSLIRDAEAVISRHLPARIRAHLTCSPSSSGSSQPPVLTVTLLERGRPVQTLRFDLQAVL